ncbi:30S ribosomal protein S6 [Patescibacteria group bacterium]|nr:30S ribosomal protein S6 [Patescibacteria group bacterium]MBU1123364.1 30S ribosomal protein S6 [Patescibacteria group bacterium]MBU1911656.1 30S ribosomal protein S6 [Patescibacteria group bacterium]
MTDTADIAEETEIDTRIYECAVLYPFPLNQKEEKEAHDGVEEIFEEAGAKQVAKDAWGRRGLAYPIKKHSEGSFVIYHYDMDPSKVKEVSDALKIAHNVLRFLLIKPPKGYEIVKFSAGYERWLKERGTEEDRKEEAKEEAIKRRVADKAKRQVRRVEEEKKEKPEAKEVTPIEADKLTAELEKIISDDELDF